MAWNRDHSARRNDEIEFDDDGVSTFCCFIIWRENGGWFFLMVGWLRSWERHNTKLGHPFHGVLHGIFKLEIFYFFVEEPRHFSVRHHTISTGCFDLVQFYQGGLLVKIALCHKDRSFRVIIQRSLDILLVHHDLPVMMMPEAASYYSLFQLSNQFLRIDVSDVMVAVSASCLCAASCWSSRFQKFWDNLKGRKWLSKNKFCSVSTHEHFLWCWNGGGVRKLHPPKIILREAEPSSKNKFYQVIPVIPQ